MSQNVASFTWTANAEQAVALVADGKPTNAEIGRLVGVTPRTIERWKRHPQFAAKVAALVAAAQEAARKHTIANKQDRVAFLDDRHERLNQVLTARGEQYADVPGGKTGMLVREPKIVKVYDVKNWGGDDGDDGDNEQLTPTGNVRVVYEYKVDTGTLAELRQIEKQAAQEVGEWVEKRDDTQRRVTTPENLDLSRLSDEELAELERLTGKATTEAL